MVWIALGLLGFMTLLIVIISPRAWDFKTWRVPPRRGLVQIDALRAMKAFALPGDPATLAVAGAYDATLHNEQVHLQHAVPRFSRAVVFSIFTTFLLPLWSLSFATEGLGREREARNLLWLLTRPLSRPAIYLAKYVAILPWCLGLNLGGFALLCLAAGPPGRIALGLYWPAVLFGTLAFCALFHLMGAWFRRAAVVALLYSFFLETVAGNLPGYLKRFSISFYVRSLMFDRAESWGIEPDRPLLFMATTGAAAYVWLLGITVVLLVVGMVVFQRSEYLDLG